MTLDPSRCRCGLDCRCRQPWGTRRQYAHKWAVSPASLTRLPVVQMSPTSIAFWMDLPMQAGLADTFSEAEG